MTTNQILSVVMSVLMVSMCGIYARTKKNGANNLFSMLMLGIGSAVLGILTWRNPFWWMLGIQAYAFCGLWVFCVFNLDNNERFIYSRYLTRIGRWRIPVLVSTAASVLTTSVLQMMNAESWGVYVEFSPLAIVTVVVLLTVLYYALEEI